MTWYVDTSAFVKLVGRESESRPLDRWIAGREICSCDLLRTEARRAIADDDGGAHELLDGLLERIVMIRLTPDVFDEAGRLPSLTRLRSLDAIHISAARRLGTDLEGVVTYDRQMAASAESLGIPVSAPTDRGGPLHDAQGEAG